MQLELFYTETKLQKTYHDERGRFCSREKALKRRIEMLKKDRDMWLRAYLIVAKQLNEGKRNAN